MRSLGTIGILIAMVIVLLLVGKRLTAPAVPSTVADQVEESTGKRPENVTDLTDVARDRVQMMEKRAVNVERELESDQ